MRMTTEQVLAILMRDGGYVSGEAISDRLGISRAAVHTAVNRLRAGGYEIESATRRGYRLVQAPDRLTHAAVCAALPDGRGETVVCLDTVDSTNKYLRELAFSGAPDGQVVIADQQTAGRGRLGRTFVSPEGRGIYLSMLLRPQGGPADTASITAWTAVAVREAIAAACGITPGIKWVNDLVLGNRKVCGILTELSLESETGRIQHIITGIGVNVNHTEADFPPELHPVATSLFMESGVRQNRAALAAQMILALDRMRAAWPQGRQAYLSAYRQANVTVGRQVQVITADGAREAFAQGINADFSLSVRYPDGKCASLTSGEVSVRGLYGYV